MRPVDHAVRQHAAFLRVLAVFPSLFHGHPRLRRGYRQGSRLSITGGLAKTPAHLFVRPICPGSTPPCGLVSFSTSPSTVLSARMVSGSSRAIGVPFEA